MPFRLNEYDRAFSLFVSDAMRELALARNDLLADIELEEQPGTLSSVFQNSGGQDVHLEAESIESDFVMSAASVRNGIIEDLVTQIDLASAQLAEGMMRSLIGTLDTVTAATGNVVQRAGRPPFEAILESLEQLEWSLTDDDELSMPTMLMHPSAVANLPSATAEQEAKVEELKERKLKELLARRRRRRLS